jgi:hypothetical protein
MVMLGLLVESANAPWDLDSWRLTLGLTNSTSSSIKSKAERSTSDADWIFLLPNRPHSMVDVDAHRRGETDGYSIPAWWSLGHHNGFSKQRVNFRTLASWWIGPPAVCMVMLWWDPDEVPEVGRRSSSPAGIRILRLRNRLDLLRLPTMLMVGTAVEALSEFLISRFSRFSWELISQRSTCWRADPDSGS